MKKFKRFVRIVIFFTILFALIAAAVYVPLLRPWILTMGTSRDEQHMEMPGDGLVTDANNKYMQAVTIKAPGEIVWQYLVQVGCRRAGWYNWDFINRMASKDYFYENNKSADRIIPELQNLKAGDKIVLVPNVSELNVEVLKKNESMLLTAQNNGKYIITWSFVLKASDSNTTRLYVRWNGNTGNDIITRVMNFLVIEPGGAGIQQSQMLQGIKKRAERDYKNGNITAGVQPGTEQAQTTAAETTAEATAGTTAAEATAETAKPQSADPAKPEGEGQSGVAGAKPDEKDYSKIGFKLWGQEIAFILDNANTAEEIISKLGVAEEKSETSVWGADGLEHQSWYYKTKGIELDLIKRDGVQVINSVRLGSSSSLKTSRGIGIGSTREEVLKAYDYEMDKNRNLKSNIMVAGTQFGGVIFMFENDKVSSVFVGAAAE